MSGFCLLSTKRLRTAAEHGAFGYAEDQVGEASDRAVLHNIGVFLTVAAGILTVAVSLAARRSAGQSRLLVATAALAALVMVAFEIGALSFDN